MATCSSCGYAATGATPATASPFCRPEEDPFLLLESSLRAVQETLLRRRGLPLRRSWIDQPYGEEELTLLACTAATPTRWMSGNAR